MKLEDLKEKEQEVSNQKDNPKTFGEGLKWIGFYLMPLFIFLFFMGMFIFVTVPRFNEMLSRLSYIEDLNSQISVKNSIIGTLENLQTNQAQNSNSLNRVETLVPSESTQVVEFKDTLTDTAKSVGLQVTKARAGESIIEDKEQIFEAGDEKSLVLVQIPTELSAEGAIESFENFLSRLYDSRDFFVVEEMEIAKAGEGNTWKADFVIVKYQFNGNVVLPEDFESDVNAIPSPLVVEFLERKFETN
ncbi:MAG TPA: hypothetical protein VGA67_00160 [Candidatus Dojkabacteria bacterium]|jgi:hypothetical protein